MTKQITKSPKTNNKIVLLVKILKKIGVNGKVWEKAEVKLLRDLTEKSVNFSTLNWQLSALDICYFLVRKSINEIIPIVEKKKMKKNSGKLQVFDETISLPESKFYPRIYGDCNSS